MHNEIHDWLITHLGNAKTKEQLAAISQMIKDDVKFGDDYAKDEVFLETAREVHKARSMELTISGVKK